MCKNIVKVFCSALIFLISFIYANNSAILINEDGKVAINVADNHIPSNDLEVNGQIEISEGIVIRPVAELPEEKDGTIVYHNGRLKIFLANKWCTLSISASPDAQILGGDITVDFGDTVTLDGSSSTSPNGNIVSYEWHEGSVLLASSETFTKSDWSPGVHTITLTITDESDEVSQISTTVTVNEVNNSPSLPLMISFEDESFFTHDILPKVDSSLASSGADGAFIALGTSIASNENTTSKKYLSTELNIPIDNSIVKFKVRCLFALSETEQGRIQSKVRIKLSNDSGVSYWTPGWKDVNNVGDLEELVFSKSSIIKENSIIIGLEIIVKQSDASGVFPAQDVFVDKLIIEGLTE